MFLMWLGEQITERGIGNGISLIITAGIVSGIPSGIVRFVNFDWTRLYEYVDGGINCDWYFAVDSML